jgi:hypothetical protein
MPRMTPAQIDRANDLKRSGLSDQQIAEDLGFSRESITRMFLRERKKATSEATAPLEKGSRIKEIEKTVTEALSPSSVSPANASDQIRVAKQQTLYLSTVIANETIRLTNCLTKASSREEKSDIAADLKIIEAASKAQSSATNSAKVAAGAEWDHVTLDEPKVSPPTALDREIAELENQILNGIM